MKPALNELKSYNDGYMAASYFYEQKIFGAKRPQCPFERSKSPINYDGWNSGFYDALFDLSVINCISLDFIKSYLQLYSEDFRKA